MPLFLTMDNLINQSIEFDESAQTVTTRTWQPSEDIILERNNELRKNPGVVRDLGKDSDGGAIGRQVASIPQQVYNEAIANGFAINHYDPQIKSREYKRFFETPIGKACLILDKV